MRRTLVALATVAATLAVLAMTATAAMAAAGAVKGGWAATTLDERVQPEPGETTEVGFTILQHGRTPVNVDDVAVIIRVADDAAGAGREQEWPAVQQGETGHYVAEVTFPDEGRYDWAVRQGWFGEYDLGTLRVGDIGDSAGATATAEGWWDGTSWPLRILLVLPILASAGLYVLDRTRRRRSDRTRQADQAVIAGA